MTRTGFVTRMKQHQIRWAVEHGLGQGKAASHSGGRYIWQLHGCHSLLICWKATEAEPRDVERELISAFCRKFGMRPFANLQDYRQRLAPTL